jgi:hypothetical protein
VDPEEPVDPVDPEELVDPEEPVDPVEDVEGTREHTFPIFEKPVMQLNPHTLPLETADVAFAGVGHMDV